MIKSAVAVAALAMTLAGCSTTEALLAPPPPGSGIYVASEDPDGVVRFRPLRVNEGPKTEFLSTGIMSEGPLAAPAPGKGWR